jgi:hypothetical protein
MGQQEIMELLRKHPKKWFTAKEIEKNVGTHVATCMVRMRKSNFIRFKQNCNRGRGTYLYQYNDN